MEPSLHKHFDFFIVLLTTSGLAFYMHRLALGGWVFIFDLASLYAL